MKRNIIIVIGICLLTIFGIWYWNYTTLQAKMNDVIKKDYRNSGIGITVRYGNYTNPDKLIYDMHTIPDDAAPVDVFRVLLQFAEKKQDTQFKVVVLCWRGDPKFLLDGKYFRQLGKEYSWQNPIYTMHTFPENVKHLDGTAAYSCWTGGWLGVALKQTEDHYDFHCKWYIDDLSKETY